jgi:O-antigen/teichoic acid export membrane protein
LLALADREVAVALSGSEHTSALSYAGATARLSRWFTDTSDHSLAQRLASTVFLIRVLGAGFAFVTQIVLARWMGSFEFGIYVYVWTWVLLLGGVVDLGLASSAQRFIPEYRERKAFAHLRGFLAGSRWLAVGSAFVIALVGALIVRLLAPWLDDYTIIPLCLACAILPAYALGNTQDVISRAHDWMGLALAPAFIVRQFLLVGLVGGIYAAGLPLNAVTVMIAAIVAVWTTVLGQLLLLNRRLTQNMERGPKAYQTRLWFATALPIVLVEGFYLLLAHTDVILLEQFRPPNEVAFYYAAAKILALVVFIHYAISATTAHRFSRYHVAGDRTQLAAFLAQSIQWTFWPSVAVTAVLLIFGRPLLWLFGEGFTQGYHLMFILAVGLLARAAIGPVERLLNMLGEQRICALVYAGAFVLNFLLCLMLIPSFGAAGAATATATALVVESILLFVVTKRRLGLHVFVWSRAGG